MATLVMPLERLVSQVRAGQLFDNQGVRPFDPQLAERLAAMSVGDTFVIESLSEGMTARSIKTYYNRTAREIGVHLHWRKGDNPIAAQLVAEPTYEDLLAENRRLATRRRLARRPQSRDRGSFSELNNGVVSASISDRR